MTFLSFLSSCTRITAQLCIRDDTIGYFTWHVKRYIVNTEHFNSRTKKIVGPKPGPKLSLANFCGF